MPAHRQRRIEFSQNFLHDPGLARRLVSESSIGRDDVVVEIGPGRGILTDVLANRARHVIAIERDPAQVAVLQRRYRDHANVTLFTADAREFPMPSTAYKVFANLPFRITADVIAKLTSGSSPTEDAYLVVQREAAERFLGRPESTLVSIRLEPWFSGSIVHTFRRSDFRPAPGVDSVLLRLTARVPPLIAHEERGSYEDMVVGLFTAWAPTVLAALTGKMPGKTVKALPEALRDALRVRPSACPAETWLVLFEVLRTAGDGRALTRFDGAAAGLERQQATLQKDNRSRTARNSRPR